MKIRVKFRKWGVMKFVGHLDLMRYFQKAVRRADIPICYSEGFSPHQIMSFAAPLGVGITSDGEYFDIEVQDTLPSAAAIKALNAVMTDGVEVTGYVKLPDHAKTGMAIVAAADYEIFDKEGCANPCTAAQWEQSIATVFWEQSEFVITKKTKKSERRIDLKPLVYEFGVREREQLPVFSMRVRTGSTDNTKPDLVLSSVYEKCGIVYCPDNLQIHRKELYTIDETTGEFVSLLSMGEEIR